MLIDSHAHLDDPKFEGELDEVLARAREAGIGRIVTIGTSLESSRRAREIAGKYEEVYYAAGIHPHEANEPGPVGELASLTGPKCVALGETGLDYFYDFADRANQKILFEKHLELATAADLPITIHCREAHADTVAILTGAGQRGVIHCFSGSVADAEAYVKLGFHLSIAGPVTYKKSDTLRDAVRNIPIDRLMVETDSPLLAPQARRGKRNEPAYVRYTAEEVARVRGMDIAEVEEATERNTRAVFRMQ